jgi:penicillin amidase
MLKAIIQIMVGLLIGAACCTASSLSMAGQVEAGASSNAKQTVRLAGLRQPVEILLDRWGVAHIYAANQDDVFFAQGYNAARDRLFQIDLWRRRGLGRLSAVLGPTFVEQDKAARQFLYRGDMQKEWSAYGSRAQAIAESFVAGINAYIDQLIAEPGRLPLEFKTFGYAPEKWDAQDVVRIRSHALTRNLYSELARAHSACQTDLKTDEVRVSLSPPWQTKLPVGLDPCLPPDLLRVFQLATQGVSLSKAAGQAAVLTTGQRLAQDASEEGAQPSEGSNAWVIAPTKSSTGRAILASDPHRAYAAPSLRYITHLSAPQLDVIGAGEPALPGISIGHNGSIAFGLTIFSIDQEDLYVYELNPANPTEYKYQGQWEKFSVLNEPIMVKGAEPVNAELKFSRHGPVIYAERARNRAFAVRSGWFEAGMAPYFGSINYMFAKNFQEFKQALLHWGAPAENQIYADVKGNIGWVSGGLAPVRPNWDGLLPVPGDGRYEWAGFLAGDKLPWSYNPQQGWFASANEMNLPPDYPYRERKLGFEWPSADRYKRLSEVLSKPAKHSIADSMRLQNDLLSVPARRLVNLLRDLDSSDGRTQAALKLLKGWNFVESADSAPAALFEVWWSRYLAYVFKQGALSKAATATLGSVDTAYLLNALERPQAAFASDALARRDWVLLTSLTLAWMDTQKLLGADPKQWQWGKLQQALIEHPFAAAVDAPTRAKLNVGPMPKHGGAHTPNMSSYDPRNFRQTAGPSFRVVLDVGNWDNSRAINTPGQSGDPDSPHYRDLAPLWLKGDYFPLLYSRKRIEAATLRRIELLPQ